MNQIYLDTARLMIQAAPLVFAGDVFALKGGTAINLFIRDMPRLSVDLDLVFPEHTLPREQALNRITTRLRESAKHLNARGFQTRNVPAQDASETKLLVRRDGIEIKIEVNFVLRGTLHPVRTASLTKKARATLLADLELPVVSLEDVYGGKPAFSSLYTITTPASLFADSSALTKWSNSFSIMLPISFAGRRCIASSITPSERCHERALPLKDFMFLSPHRNQ